MDRVDLRKLYTTGEFADCTFVSSSGEEFPAHRFLFGRFPRLKELIAEGGQVHLSEPTEVVERLLRWVYGVEWVAPENVQPTRMGVGKELMDIMALCDAAEKYEIPKLVDDAHATAGRVLDHLNTSAVTLRILKDLTDKDSAVGLLRRTVIDRALHLLPNQAATSPRNKKRSQQDDMERESASEADGDVYSNVVSVPKRSGRKTKATAKAKEFVYLMLCLLKLTELYSSTMPKKRRKTVFVKQERKSAASEDGLNQDKVTVEKQHNNPITPYLYCVCKKPEDPYLVECEKCERWFHPGCIGKGKYTGWTQSNKTRHFGQKLDEKWYREGNLSFICTDCEHELA